MNKRALLSVSDKTGIVAFAKGLIQLGYEIVSTGGTANALQAGGVEITGISDVTGFPECLDGRVKTLHPAVHAGILAMRARPEHMKQLEQLHIVPFDIVAVNLYPFKQTIQNPSVTMAEAVENIDIGGPAMVRSAAKNYQDVWVVVDPDDYTPVLDALQAEGEGLEARFRLMYKAFQHTALYDTLIAGYLREKLALEYPDTVTFAYEKAQSLRYGENPHQSAAFYREVLPAAGALSDAVQLHGKELSFNNINDVNGALELLREFDQPAAVAVKHSNPCGVAVAQTILEAYQRAYACDPVSIYGGIVALNRPVDSATAAEMHKLFLEVIIAPDFDREAVGILAQKPNVRLLRLQEILPRHSGKQYTMKKVCGGLLIQQQDETLFDRDAIQFPTKLRPSETDIRELMFAYGLVKHTKSNAIVLTKDFASIGIGSGQTNRIWACKQAIEHAGDRTKGSYAASDAYFPFPDCVQELADAGVKAIIQPGGSIRDQESIALCDQLGVSMIFVGTRHFKH